MVKRLFSRRPSHGTVVAYLALFVALGGTAYAANEFTGRNIVNGSIKSVDLGANSVNGAKVVNNSVKGADVLESSLGTVPRASSVVPGAIGGLELADDAVTPAELAQVPAANTLWISAPETTNSAAGKTLHANFDIYDTAGLHDEGSSSEFFVAPVDGMYVVSATVDWEPNGTGYRRSTITGPSGPVASVSGPPLAAPAYTSQQVTGIERLAAGQSVKVEVLQGSGGNLGAHLSRFQITYVGGY